MKFTTAALLLLAAANTVAGSWSNSHDNAETEDDVLIVQLCC